MKNNITFLLLLTIALCGCQNNGERQNKCSIKKECLSNTDCLCWCSQICNYRRKIAEDKPIYVENDPNGKFCYCKQWDLDYYKDNCILHKNIKQPKNAD